MKRRILLLFIALALFCTACAQSQQQGSTQDSANGGGTSDSHSPSDEENETEESETVASPLLEDYLESQDVLESPIRDYGDSVSYMQMEDDFVARILYPEGDVESLRIAVEDWVRQTAAQYQEESVGSSVDGDSAELTVDYSSYLIDDAFVSVKLVGVYERPYIAHPIDVYASFNANKTTGELLELDDVLLPGGREALKTMVVEDAGVAENSVDENLLSNWLLTPGGLEITLTRGDYLPMSSGTVTLLYAFEQLDGIISLSGQAPQAQPEPIASPPAPASEMANPSPVDSSKPMLALTFDDGPSSHTERLLDVFAAHGGKGTFFVVGNMLDRRAETLQRMAADGHEIGGHSWDHRQLTKLSAAEMTDQLMSTRAKIYSITGLDATMVRPPYGSCNDQLKTKAKELDIALINWSVDTLDWKYKDADTVYQAVMDGAKDGAIILCHDLHKTTVDAMERAIPDLIAAGYQLVTVTELLTSEGGSITPGRLYFSR